MTSSCPSSTTTAMNPKRQVEGGRLATLPGWLAGCVCVCVWRRGGGEGRGGVARLLLTQAGIQRHCLPRGGPIADARREPRTLPPRAVHDRRRRSPICAVCAQALRDTAHAVPDRRRSRGHAAQRRGAPVAKGGGCSGRLQQGTPVVVLSAGIECACSTRFTRAPALCAGPGSQREQVRVLAAKPPPSKRPPQPPLSRTGPLPRSKRR